MKRLLMMFPTWETFLIYIGGIPTIITTAIFGFMVFIGARNKAFSLKDYNELRYINKKLLKEEEALRTNVLKAPSIVQWIYRKWIGEINYYDLVNRR